MKKLTLILFVLSFTLRAHGFSPECGDRIAKLNSLKKSPTEMASQDYGLIGVGVMGGNFAMRAAEQGKSSAVFDLNASVSHDLAAVKAPHLDIIATQSLAELIKSLKSPRRIMLLVPDGKPVDSVLKELLETHLLQPGDTIIESANSLYSDTQARMEDLKKLGINYLGQGISGGERGARSGPSLMIGGDQDVYNKYWKDVAEAAAGRSEIDGLPAADWMGPAGAGHYVKMVHNGIEYDQMQILGEIYHLLLASGLTNENIGELFEQWNKTEAQSFLLDLASKVVLKVDPLMGDKLIDKVQDRAAQKGTGKFTQIDSLMSGASSPSISAAVEARSLSSYWELRQLLSKQIAGPRPRRLNQKSLEKVIEAAKGAYLEGTLMSFVQGFNVLKEGSNLHNLDLSPLKISKTWRAGCILQGALVNQIADIYASDPEASKYLLLSKNIQEKVNQSQKALRDFIIVAVRKGVPTPSLSATLAYIDGARSDLLPGARLIQGERDAFGAHKIMRNDGKTQNATHEDWWTP